MRRQQDRMECRRTSQRPRCDGIHTLVSVDKTTRSSWVPRYVTGLKTLWHALVSTVLKWLVGALTTLPTISTNADDD